MECTSQPPQMPRQASKKGGRSGHGLRFRRGAAAPEAVMQPQSRTMTYAVADMHVQTGVSRTLGSVSHVRPSHGIWSASRVRPTVSPN